MAGKKKSLVGWAGIVNDTISRTKHQDDVIPNTTYDIYTNQRTAKRIFQCIAKVRITIEELT